MDSMPVIYKESTLVVRTKDGVAAIVFDKPLDKGVTYRYRFLPDGQDKERIGEGRVFEEYKKAGSLSIFGYVGFQYDTNEGKTSLEAGLISLSWHYRTRESCWITYHPTLTRIQATDAKDFTRIDLKRSLK